MADPLGATGFTSFEQYWNEATSRAALDQKSKDYYGKILSDYLTDMGVEKPMSYVEIKIPGREPVQYMESAETKQAEGKLLKGSNKEIYIISNGKRCHIPNWTVFKGLGYRAEDVETIADSKLMAIPEGNQYGRIVQAPDRKLYLQLGNAAHYITSMDVIKRMGIPPTNVFERVSQDEINSYTKGEDVTYSWPRPEGVLLQGSGKEVYLVGPDHTIRHIASSDVFTKSGFRWENIVKISDEELGKYKKAGKITEPLAQGEYATQRDTETNFYTAQNIYNNAAEQIKNQFGEAHVQQLINSGQLYMKAGVKNYDGTITEYDVPTNPNELETFLEKLKQGALKAEEGWESNTYLGRAHQEWEEALAEQDLGVEEAKKRAEIQYADIGNQEERERLVLEAAKEEFIRERTQVGSELSLQKAMLTNQWGSWKGEEQQAWQDWRTKTGAALGKGSIQGGRASGIFQEAARNRYGNIGREQEAYMLGLQEAQLGYTGTIGDVDYQEKVKQLAYDAAIKDLGIERQKTAYDVGSAGRMADFLKGQAGTSYGWAKGGYGMQQKEREREIEEQRKEAIDAWLAGEKASKLAEYTKLYQQSSGVNY